MAKKDKNIWEEDEDWPIIDYWKAGLLKKESEDELYEHLLSYDGGYYDYSEARQTIKGNYLGAEYLRLIYTERQPLSLVLKTHLITENLVNLVFDNFGLEKTKKTKQREINLTFQQKVDKLFYNKYLDIELALDLYFLNKLRNEFAHNYYFHIGEFNISDFSIVGNFYKGLKCKRKKTRAVLNLKTLQFFIFPMLLESIMNKFEFLLEKKLTKLPHKVFWKDKPSKGLGRLIDFAEEQTKGTDLEWTAKITIKDKSHELEEDEHLEISGK